MPLGASESDRYRLYCVTERGRVTIFRVQYEAYIDGEWWPVVRYDTAHGFPQRDLMSICFLPVRFAQAQPF